MQFGVRRVAALVAVVLATAGVSISDAAALGKQCYSNSDCGDGSFCVAGDSQTSVQRCVAGTPCGGKISGACPGDEQSGQLACIWRPDSETCAKSPSGCLELDGDLGIYKCISIARCDQYLAGQCSASCNVNGKQCNGRGTCQLSGGSASKPKFECACDSGWNGTRCNGVVDDSCVVDVGQCGDHGTCVKNACTCKDGYTGVQCQIPPKSKSGSGSGATKTPTPTPTNKSTSSPNSSASKANSGDVVTSKKNGPSPLVIIIAVLVALIVVGAIVFVVLARKRRRQQEAADNSGFNRTDSVLAGGEARTGPPTPKQKIVIM